MFGGVGEDGEEKERGEDVKAAEAIKDMIDGSFV